MAGSGTLVVRSAIRPLAWAKATMAGSSMAGGPKEAPAAPSLKLAASSPKSMPLPQVYLAKHRRDAWSASNVKDDWMRDRNIAANNFLNIRRSEGGDFVFNIRADDPSPLYFGYNHPDMIRFYERGPFSASQIAGRTWDVVLPEPATLNLSFKPLFDADGKPQFAAAFFSLIPDFNNTQDGLTI